MTDEIKQDLDEFTREGIRHIIETNDCSSNTIIKEKDGTTEADAIIYALKMFESNSRQMATMTGINLMTSEGLNSLIHDINRLLDKYKMTPNINNDLEDVKTKLKVIYNNITLGYNVASSASGKRIW